jgi:hypothetical protein
VVFYDISFFIIDFKTAFRKNFLLMICEVNVDKKVDNAKPRTSYDSGFVLEGLRIFLFLLMLLFPYFHRRQYRGNRQKHNQERQPVIPESRADGGDKLHQFLGAG